MRPLYGHSETVSKFVASLIPGMERGFGECTAIGVLDEENRLIGGVVYHNYNPEAGIIEFSGASLSRKWYGRHMLEVFFSYPFDQLKCQMVITRNSEKNTRLHRQLKVYGFTLYRIKRGRGRNEDEMLWTLTEEDWRANRFHRGGEH